ncbi:MAG: hypothetical protein LBM77_12570 [Spirochaetaceae bacterium]|jgi:hypothetical protein|nr:hypothetical protein [Spirochaetaceae bacterium]
MGKIMLNNYSSTEHHFKGAFLVKHYGFSKEDLNFIVNYDIKHRMALEIWVRER